MSNLDAGSELVYDTARAVADLMCGVVSVRVGVGYPLVADHEEVAFVALTFKDDDGRSLTIGLTWEQTDKLRVDLARYARSPRRP